MPTRRKKEPPVGPRAEWVPVAEETPPVPGAVQTQPLETASLVIANGGTTSSSAEVGAPSEIGLLVPTLTNGTLTVQVSNNDTDYFPVKDKDGAAVLVMAASTGVYAIDGNALGAVLAYRYFRVVAGAAQGAERTLTACRKISRTDPLA